MTLNKRKCLLVIAWYICEDIDNYAQLGKILYDFQASDDAVKGRLAVTSATNPQYNVTSGTIVRGVNRGATTGVTTTATTVPFAINLISLVGALAGEKYLPLWQMTAAPLRVEIVLKSSVVTSLMSLAGTATAQLFTMTSVNYCGEFLELPDSAISAINAGSSSPMQMVLPSYRSFTNSAAITTAGTSVSFPIPAKYSSLKNLFVATRTSVGADGLYPNSHCKYGLTSYSFRVGAEVLPSTQPATVPEFYSEAVKCFGSLADLAFQPSVDLVSYALDVPNTIASSGDASLLDSGSFVVGMDMEVYSNADKSSIFAGTNTNNSDIFFNANFTPAGNVTILQTAFASYDQVLVYESGVCYARY